MSTRQTTSELVRDIKEAGEDYEFYPSTSTIIAAVARWLDKGAHSLMDIGAGDGRVLTQLAAHFPHPESLDLYAIEKSSVLVQAQPENIIPVGTELFEQNLACLPVDFLFSNPPYSEYETWACMVIETGHARRAYLVIPRRWQENPAIAAALKRRRATARIIHSDDFYDAPRRSRAVVDVVEITYPRKDCSYGRGGLEDIADPFDTWFDANISTFDSEEPQPDYDTEYQAAQRGIAKIRHLSTIEDLVAAYREEYMRMEMNYRAIFQLDYELLRELGIKKDAIRDGIKKKMAGLKSRYWTVLFERLDAITNRLSTATKKEFLERLTGRTAIEFTAGNAYSIVLWAIKNANRYFDRQAVALYRELSTFEGVLLYKSNVRTWAKDGWRYLNREEKREALGAYALDYRIVIERYRAIYTGDGFGTYDYPGGLAKSCHETIADIIAVLFNLGFPVHSECASSFDRGWYSGGWQSWYGLGARKEDILFQVKAYKNGNLHFRFAPEAIKTLNVVAGRLLGWLRSATDVEVELGYTQQEASKLYSLRQAIKPSIIKLLTGQIPEPTDER